MAAAAGPPSANALLYPSGDTVVEGQVSKGDEKVHVVYHLPHQRMVYDGKRMRKAITRRTVDYNNGLMLWTHKRLYEQDFRDRRAIQPHDSFVKELLPPEAMADQPVSHITGRYVHTSQNKVRCPVNVVTWTPEGRRLITGSSSGEFTLWNGLTFNFETILQAHDGAVRAMVWSHNENWMIAGDQTGTIKYWQTNMNNAKAFQGHKESIRGLSFAPTDLKFASCSDDVSIKIWDFATCRDENTLTGHGWDVKCIAWHPYSSMLVSGSKDNLIKIWDAKSATNIATLHGHKNTVADVTWNQNGNWLLSCSRDQLIKLYDIRMMRELQTFRGHKREVTTLAWHPFQENFFVSGGFDGSIMFWLVGSDEPQADMPNAHDNSVWDLAWHPLGHVLCSGSNDHTTKFWCRNRPGDPMTDKYSGGTIVLDVVEDEHGNQQAVNPAIASKQVEKKNFVVEPGLVGVRPEEPVPIPGLGMGPVPSRQPNGPAPYSRAPPPHAAGGPRMPPPPPGMHAPGHGYPPNMPPPPPGYFQQQQHGQYQRHGR